MKNHPFDLALQLKPREPGVYGGTTSEAYWNMVGPFGGVTAATALNAVLQHPALLGEPVYLLGQARAQTFRNGFFDQTSQLWSEAGLLLATTSQIVYYKE